MATVKTVLRKTKLADGSYPISLRVSKDRNSKFFQTIFRAFPNEWNETTGSFTAKNSNSIQNNRLLLKFKDRALKILSDLEMEKSDFTLKDFENHFRIVSNPVQQNLFYFWDEIIGEMIYAGRTGNAKVNKDTFESLKKFNKSTKLNFKEITPSFLYKYEAFLRSRGGSDGGIGVRMRTIRALYNFAIERNIAKEQDYPFKIYKVSKLKGKNLKKALSIEEVLKIRDLDLKKYPSFVNTRNYFIFSFYTRGMNFADMMKLEWKDTDCDKIYYTRSKTKGHFKIKIVLPVQEILSYYRKHSIGTNYIFPILLKNNLTPAQLENRKHKTLQRYNKELKEIAEICEINKPLSSYVARHSFANCLKQKGVATDIISESMGHQNLAVTQAYLKEFDNSVLDDAIEILV
ncbi:site-specific integrase [Gelidibacter salicanalis]|uniref:Site-specific integrase n=1 Tax=Gelidibacter salicanalis TaxID=291193 RepID=A0A5C7ALB6_9FLAO|nr:site-specific integrase [Gelidibacter salicanalis]TXE08383.1 site-specific integrase [Gelidibacter salicanalis]